jgi:arsenite methyltransferase
MIWQPFTKLVPVLMMCACCVTVLAQRAGDSITPERILELLEVRQGGTVCELGSGDGSTAIAAARIVGPGGRVYANELGEDHLKKLREKISASGLASQITVVASESTKTNFPDGACDGVFMRDVYHHLSDPAAIHASIASALKPGGRVAIIDFKPPGKEADKPADRSKDGKHGVMPATVTREMQEAGFQSVSSETPSARWFLLVFAKPGPRT